MNHEHCLQGCLSWLRALQRGAGVDPPRSRWAAAFCRCTSTPAETDSDKAMCSTHPQKKGSAVCWAQRDSALAAGHRLCTLAGGTGITCRQHLLAASYKGRLLLCVLVMRQPVCGQITSLTTQRLPSWPCRWLRSLETKHTSRAGRSTLTTHTPASVRPFGAVPQTPALALCLTSASSPLSSQVMCGITPYASSSAWCSAWTW